MTSMTSLLPSTAAVVLDMAASFFRCTFQSTIRINSVFVFHDISSNLVPGHGFGINRNEIRVLVSFSLNSFPIKIGESMVKPKPQNAQIFLQKW